MKQGLQLALLNPAFLWFQMKLYFILTLPNGTNLPIGSCEMMFYMGSVKSSLPIGSYRLFSVRVGQDMSEKSLLCRKKNPTQNSCIQIRIY